MKNKVSKKEASELCEFYVKRVKNRQREEDEATLEKYKGTTVGFWWWKYEIRTKEELEDYVFNQTVDEDHFWPREWRSVVAQKWADIATGILRKITLTKGEFYYPSDEELDLLATAKELHKRQ